MGKALQRQSSKPTAESGRLYPKLSESQRAESLREFNRLLRQGLVQPERKPQPGKPRLPQGSPDPMKPPR